jgi:murein DD-endopeptidase MepM/ murein hydrolase activator NlpD
MRMFLLTALLGFLSGCAALHPRIEDHGEVIYTVAKGDTFDRIARKVGVSSEQIAAYNGLKKSSPIHPGQIMKIPALGPLSGDPSRSAFKGDAQTKMVSIASAKPYVGRFAFPVQGARFTSPFGWRWSRFHEGADFAAPQGTPIYAAHGGVVVFASEAHGRYGKVVVVKGDGLITVYGHNSRNIASVGDMVKKGEHIANVGSTGKSSGPHLHFETRVRDERGRWVAVDPYIFFVHLQGA